MRLGPFDTSEINVRSSDGGGIGRAGGIGCGTLLIALVGALVFGIDPRQTIGMVESVQQQTAPTSAEQGGNQLSEDEVCASSAYATEACAALANLNRTWRAAFAQSGVRFAEPGLDLFRNGQVTTNGCGSATSAAGPFYCPADQVIYIDTSFYDELARMSGTGGDFARLYVIGHEYGHHIQNLTGLAGQVRAEQRRNPAAANSLQVAMELQADCYAGMWASKNRDAVEPGDLEEGMQAASAIGDDTLQRNAGQQVSPEGFTHGSSRQRMAALKLGLASTDNTACNVFFEGN